MLVAVPLLLNVPFALAGHPVLDGDNLTQNYPLRVLSGQLIAHGRLPLGDPGIWSGVPLLAGWNAGSMFPGTWLFAVLPGVAAYELNVVAAGVACGALGALGVAPDAPVAVSNASAATTAPRTAARAARRGLIRRRSAG